jgi:hypothetical protein
MQYESQTYPSDRPDGGIVGIESPYRRNMVLCLGYAVQTSGFYLSAASQLSAYRICNSVSVAAAGVSTGNSQIQMEQGIVSSDIGTDSLSDIVCRIFDFGYGMG